MPYLSSNKEGTSQNAGVYPPFPIPENNWEDLSIESVLDLPKTPRHVVDRLFKMVHFVACKKTSDARCKAQLFLKEIVKIAWHS